MMAERTVMLVKKVAYFLGIWLSEQFMNWKKYYFNVFEFLER